MTSLLARLFPRPTNPDPLAAEVRADRRGRLGATNLGSLADLIAARDAAADRAMHAERELDDTRLLAALAPAAPTPEQLWAHVRTSEQGRKARALGKAYGRASRTIAEQRGVIERLRFDVRAWKHVAHQLGFTRDQHGQTEAGADFEPRRRVRASVLDNVETVLVAHDWMSAACECRCGWSPEDVGAPSWHRHVAEQLAAVGALGPLTTPQPEPRPTPRTGSFADPASSASPDDAALWADEEWIQR